jgi:hypothetical protein
VVALAELVERLAREAAEIDIARARAAFEANTGAFAVGDAWYEERISAFFDFAVASFEGGAIARAHLPRDREAIAAIVRSERSVFRVERVEGALVCVSLFGARYRIAAQGVAARFEGGERFDGRIASHEGALHVMPGAIFHPAETHEAIDHLLAEVGKRGLPPQTRSQDALADALLRMRMRFDRFTSIQPRHLYRYDALERMDILAASWARPEKR